MIDYDKDIYKKWDWKHPIMLHWIINPGVAVSEFIGVVIPKVMLIEKDKSKSMAVRTIIPCPHCNTFHSGIKWSQQNNTHKENWYGYYCDACGDVIPPLRNWFSAIVFGVLKPFNKSQRESWLAKQPLRFENITLELETKLISLKKGLVMGLIWGVFMMVFMTSFNYFIGEDINSKFLILNAVTWIIAGLFFGLSIRWWGNKQIKKTIKSKELELQSNGVE